MSSNAAPKRPFASKGMESVRFDERRESYWQGIEEICNMGYSRADLIHHAPAFAGHLNLGRHLALYEAYKMTQKLPGHIAEAGVWKGAGLLLFAKLTQLFEPWSQTLVHGFDWFRGADPGSEEADVVQKGAYAESFERVQRLIDLQGLNGIVRLHNIDLAKDLPHFTETYPHLRYKLVFLDCGIYPVVRACITYFWPRMPVGSVMILDNYNHETSPGEARALHELLPDVQLHSFGFAPQPTAYVVKHTSYWDTALASSE